MRNWLITGISSGLGRALALAVLEQGDRVVGTVRSEEARADFLAIAPAGADVLLLDVTDEAAVNAAIAKAEELTGGLDVVVNNAGYGLTGAIEETTLAEARALFETNFFGPMAVIRAALPAMRTRKRGHIVNITSLSGFAPWAGTALYGATKYALECLGQTLAQEVAEFGIKVTNVAPGGLRTEFAGSLNRTALWMPDYEGAAHFSFRSLTESKGKEGGDTTLAARAICEIVALDEPPMHFFLGEDSVRHTRENLEIITGDMARWEALSVSISVPAA